MGIFPLLGCTCELPVPISFVHLKKKKRRPTKIHSILQSRISGETNSHTKPLGIPQCIHERPSSLLHCTSICYNALSRLNQKLISCNTVPDKTSLVSLVTAWMALIHELRCEWGELRNMQSAKSFDGMWERLGR